MRERHRAVAPARHGEPGPFTGDGQAYLYDPTGENARALKARYEGVCRGGADKR